VANILENDESRSHFFLILVYSADQRSLSAFGMTRQEAKMIAAGKKLLIEISK
jgi:hypothetical protein